MASVIDNKYFECTEDMLADIVDFVGPYIDGGDLLRIKIVVEKVDGQRQRKMTARNTLRGLTEEKEAYYRDYNYDFNFHQNKYSWKGKDLHITQGEALFLFRLLVLREVDHSQMYFLHNIRKRYGRGFLREVLHA
jgi:hypothetical protein